MTSTYVTDPVTGNTVNGEVVVLASGSATGGGGTATAPLFTARKQFTTAATALTRPANQTPYNALDSISDNGTAGSVTANVVTLSDTNDQPLEISEVRLASTDTAIGAAAGIIRLHLFFSNPTSSSGVVGGDNAAWSNKLAGYAGYLEGTMLAFSDGSAGVLTPPDSAVRLMTPGSGVKTIWWQLQTLTGFTPSANSTTFTPTFKGWQGRAS